MLRKSSILLLLLFSLGMPAVHAQTLDASQVIDPAITETTIYYAHLLPTSQAGVGIDAAFGLSEAPEALYGECVALLRFNTFAGTAMDVWNGTGYTRTNAVPIVQDKRYQVWFRVNWSAATYDVYVQPEDATSGTLVQSNAQFRPLEISAVRFWNTLHYAPNSTNALQVLNYGIVNNIGEIAADGALLGTHVGRLDEAAHQITSIPPGTTVVDLVSALEWKKSATLEVLDPTGQAIPLSSTEVLTSQHALRLTSSSETINTYTLEVRPVSSENKVLVCFGASIDHELKLIASLPNDLQLALFRTGIAVSAHASVAVIDATGSVLTDRNLIINRNHRVQVTAEDGSVAIYSILTGNEGLPARAITDSTATFHHLLAENLQLQGHIQWHFSAAENPLPGTRLNLESEDVWLFFHHIRPQAFFDHYLSHIRVNGQPAEPDVNMRLVQYGEGCVIISHPATYEPLTAFSGKDHSGESARFGLYTYHKALGILDKNIESIRLKRGYMATLSENTNGTGHSQVFIAKDEDLEINLPDNLQNRTSFIRVIPWRWTSKKGWSGGAHAANLLNASWHYDWNNEAESTLDLEYIPMRHNPGWNAYANINNKRNTTHALYYNEPDNPVDDGYASVADAIAAYPNMLASGLRVVSPAPTDGGTGWLFDFVNQCRERNYRLDAAAIHFYRGGQTTAQFYNFLKYVHDNTGLPLWITEWNNGANWTCCLPTYEQQAETIGDWMDMLEAAPFVERYAIYSAVQAERQLFYTGTDQHTPAGEVYRDKASRQAYLPQSHFQRNPFPAHGAIEIGTEIQLNWNIAEGTTAQLLYFGESPNPPFTSYLTRNQHTFDPGEIAHNQTYYWRVDEYRNGEWVTGPLWQFSTLSLPKAFQPTPTDGATGIADTRLSWSSVPDKSTMHWLYVGHAPDELGLVQASADTFHTLAALQSPMYYWRVDKHLLLKNGRELVTRGDVWTFATVVTSVRELPPVVVYPNPAHNVLHIRGLQQAETVSLVDMTGRILHQQHTAGLVDVSALPSGIYLLKIPGHPPVRVVK